MPWKSALEVLALRVPVAVKRKANSVKSKSTSSLILSAKSS